MMGIETELKLIVAPATVAALSALLNSLQGEHGAAQKLTNLYYETPDRLLRRHDIGLRIRGAGEQYEMTVKMAGRVVGGLHQRPEYNVPLTQPVLDLALFPTEIWPASLEVAGLQQALQPLFRTDFVRETWLVRYQQSEIELALDQGEISAGERQEPLCELELELKSGTAGDLLALAQQLAQQGGLRLGSLSKAARGYHLAQGDTQRWERPLPVLVTAAKASVEQGMIAGMELALQHWHYHEELWLAGEEKGRIAIVESIILIRQLFVLFGGLIPRKASADLRTRLMALETQLLETDCEADSFCYQSEYLQTRLALTAWLAGHLWRGAIDSKAEARLSGSFKRFADVMLSRSAAELKTAFERPLSNVLALSRLIRLQHQLHVFHLLAGAYSPAQYQPYFAQWQALAGAIIRQRTDEIEMTRKQAITQPVFWLSSANAPKE